jgi:uncharacterized protein (TIGR02217 family)
MSNAVFPSFPGLTWNVVRRPKWNTITKSSVSGREFRSAQYSYPIWQYKMSYEVLRARSALQEMQQLAAFFNARQGSYDTFLYTDPDDNSVAAQQFGVSNGSQVAYQLVRSFGGYTEPIFDVNSAPMIYNAGALQTAGTHYNISSTGLVTFVSPPALNNVLTWAGTFYWRCRFMQDQAEFNQFMRQLWELKTLEFTTVKP